MHHAIKFNYSIDSCIITPMSKRGPRRRLNPVIKDALYKIALLLLVFFVMQWIRKEFFSPGISQEEAEMEMRLEADNPLVEHTYDWRNLSWGGIRLDYDDENYTSRLGIDVSYHNGDIDWEAVKKTGIDFAIVRAGYRGYQEGKLKMDPQFRTNIEGAKDVGLDVGVYFFSQAITPEEAREEADYLLELIEGYEIDLPIVFDYEHNEVGIDRIANVSREEKTIITLTFCRHIEKAGYQPMIYASSKLFDAEFDLQYFADYPLWVADYHHYPQFDYEFDIWQYTNQGKINGIPTDVDMNLYLIEK